MLAYMAVSMLRQQLHPDLRVHGIVRYDDTHTPAPNGTSVYLNLNPHNSHVVLSDSCGDVIHLEYSCAE